MKKTALLLGVFALGFLLKVGIAEAERLAATAYVDRCFKERKPTSDEARTECYGAPNRHALYRFIAMANAQPAFWKNTKGRCVGTEGTDVDKYFQCGWWNRFAI